MERLEIPISRIMADRLKYLKKDTGLKKAEIVRKAIEVYLDANEGSIRKFFKDRR